MQTRHAAAARLQSPQLVIYGATGATGRRLVKLAVDAGLRPIVIGRNKMLLDQIAGSYGLEARVADLSPAQLDSAFADATVVISCAGPYTRFGAPIVEAAIRNGAHYVDFTGEPRYIKRLIDDYDHAAKAANVILVPAAGAGAAGGLAARAAAASLTQVHRITVSYDIRGMKQSTGTRQSMFEIMTGGAPVLDQGRLAFVKAGSRMVRLRNGFGILFPLTDPLMLSRMWPQASIESYLQTPLAPVMGLVLPMLMTFSASPRLVKILHWLQGRTRGAPAEEACGLFNITVKVEGDGKVRYGLAEIADVYTETAQAGFEVARRLWSGNGNPGVCAAGEVLGDPHQTAARIGIRLKTMEA